VKYVLMVFKILLNLDYYISVNIEDIFKMKKVIESCVHALFLNFYTKICLKQVFMAKTSCSCVYRSDF
jgi:hypothetical protein